MATKIWMELRCCWKRTHTDTAVKAALLPSLFGVHSLACCPVLLRTTAAQQVCSGSCVKHALICSIFVTPLGRHLVPRIRGLRKARRRTETPPSTVSGSPATRVSSRALELGLVAGSVDRQGYRFQLDAGAYKRPFCSSAIPEFQPATRSPTRRSGPTRAASPS